MRMHVESREFITIAPTWIESATAFRLRTVRNQGHRKAGTAPDGVLDRDNHREWKTCGHDVLAASVDEKATALRNCFLG